MIKFTAQVSETTTEGATAVDDERERWMQVAVTLGKESLQTGMGQPFGAVVVHNGIAIAQAGNEVFARCDPTAHAEILAIQRATSALKPGDLSECDIYASGVPCPMCYSAIYWARIRSIFYAATAEDLAEIVGVNCDDLYVGLSLPIEARTTPTLTAVPGARSAALASYRAWTR